MVDLIKTIEDGEKLEFDDNDSDSDKEITLATQKQRNQKKSERKGFNAEFHFDDENFYESEWNVNSALHEAIKKKSMQTTLDQKIEQVRRKRVAAKKVKQVSGNVNIDSEGKKIEEEDELDSDVDLIDDGDDDEEEDDDVLEEKDASKTDILRIKLERRRKRKLKELKELGGEDNLDIIIPLAEVKDTVEGDRTASWDPKLTFQGMNLSRPLLRAVSNMNYITPTPIQQAAIPVGLLGRDVCACAATGTGKTAAFMLPVLERLIYRPISTPVIRVLCLVPTRELAVQVFTVTQQLAKYTKVRVCLAAGGLDLKSQEASLRQSPDIVIATPGRLIDHLHNTPSFVLRYVEVLILDEADRMLDEFFEDQMTEVIKLCAPQRQTMLFSATLSDKVLGLAAVSLRNPVKIFVNSNTDVAPFLRQEFIRIRPNKEADREAIVLALCCRSFISNVLMFCQTKKQAHRLHIVFGLLGIKAGELHGNLSQAQRLENLKRFKDGQTDVLICTDLAARGLDIENVKTVINFTMPNSHQHYVHRVGRTARAGRSGRSVSLVGESERKLLKEIVKVAKNPVKSRVIPADVLSKFNEKLKEIENEVGEVLKLEAHDKEIVKSENQISKGEKIVKGEKPVKRTWFQTKLERELLRAERLLGSYTNDDLSKRGRHKDDKKKSFKRPSYSAEERVKVELDKSRQYQRRLEKRKRKPKRARACPEPQAPKKRQQHKQKRKSNFDVELTNVSKQAVVNYRKMPREIQERKKRRR